MMSAISLIGAQNGSTQRPLVVAIRTQSSRSAAAAIAKDTVSMEGTT
jgi:hypothetical protein